MIKITPLQLNALQVGLEDLIDSLELTISIEKENNLIEFDDYLPPLDEYINDIKDKLIASKRVKDKLSLIQEEYQSLLNVYDNIDITIKLKKGTK